MISLKKLIGISAASIIMLALAIFLYAFIFSHENSKKEAVTKLLKTANVTINGNNPWDVQVYNDKFYDLVYTKNIPEFFQSHEDGWWNCQDLKAFFTKAIATDFQKAVNRSPRLMISMLKAKLFDYKTNNLSKR